MPEIDVIMDPVLGEMRTRDPGGGTASFIAGTGIRIIGNTISISGATAEPVYDIVYEELNENN